MTRRTNADWSYDPRLNDDRYLLPRIPVRGLLLFLGAVVTLIAWTRP